MQRISERKLICKWVAPDGLSIKHSPQSIYNLPHNYAFDYAALSAA